MTEESSDELEMILEYDEEEVSSSDDGGESEDDGELGEFEDDENVNADNRNAGAAAAAAAGAGVLDGLLVPFEYEPLPREGDEHNNVGDAIIVDPTRLTRIDWCQCNHCEVLPSYTAGDCICCREIPQVVAEADMNETLCITQAASFEPAILDPVSLYIAWLHFTEKWRRKARGFGNRNNEKYRYVAYRKVVRWCWGFLGKDIRVQLPACVQTKVKRSYPDGAGRYKGTVLRPLEL